MTLVMIVSCTPDNNHIQTKHGWQLEGNKNFYFFLFFFNIFENPASQQANRPDKYKNVSEGK